MRAWGLMMNWALASSSIAPPSASDFSPFTERANGNRRLPCQSSPRDAASLRSLSVKGAPNCIPATVPNDVPLVDDVSRLNEATIARLRDGAVENVTDVFVPAVRSKVLEGAGDSASSRDVASVQVAKFHRAALIESCPPASGAATKRTGFDDVSSRCVPGPLPAGRVPLKYVGISCALVVEAEYVIDMLVAPTALFRRTRLPVA